MSNEDTVRQIELVSNNAWPAKEIIDMGWLVRLDEGYTRRANSVLPHAEPEMQIEDAVDDVVRLYEANGLLPRFQMSPSSLPGKLDGYLAERGFVNEFQVHVQTAGIGLLNSEACSDVILEGRPRESWYNAYQTAGNYDSTSLQARKGIFERINLQKRFASMTIDREVVSVGLGVVEGDWLGLFGIQTIEDRRRQGHATRVTEALVNWGRHVGAKKVYLQVEVGNEVAMKMYEKLGFRTLYTYWYRLQRPE